MNNTQKPSILKAVLMCILACLAGSLVFGLIYYIGYYVYYITALEIVFGVLAFLKFKQSTSKGNITIGIIVSTFWVVLFNFGAVFLCDAIVIAADYSLPFNESVNILIELWQTEQEWIAYFNQRFLEISGMALLGCVIAIFMVIGNIKKNKQKQQELTQQSYNNNINNNESYDLTLDSTQETSAEIKHDKQTKNNAQNIYFDYYSQCKMFVNNYLNDKDMTSFKENINSLRQTANQMPAELKESINIIIKNEKTIPTLSETDKKVLQIMDRMFI